MSALIIKIVEEKIEGIDSTINYIQNEIKDYQQRLKENETDRAELSAELEKLKGNK